MTKRIVSLLSAVIIALGFSGCAASESNESELTAGPNETLSYVESGKSEAEEAVVTGQTSKTDFIMERVYEVIDNYHNGGIESIKAYRVLCGSGYRGSDTLRFDIKVKDGYPDCATAYTALNYLREGVSRKIGVIGDFIEIEALVGTDNSESAEEPIENPRIRFSTLTRDIQYDGYEYEIYAYLYGDVDFGTITYDNVKKLSNIGSDGALYLPPIERIKQFPDLSFCYLKIPADGAYGKSNEELKHLYWEEYGYVFSLNLYDEADSDNPVLPAYRENKTLGAHTFSNEYPGLCGKTLVLEMTRGIKCSEKSYWGRGWSGDFRFRLTDSDSSSRYKELEEDIISKDYILHFNDEFEILMNDYNEDGNPDFAIGQWGSLSGGDESYLFTLLTDGTVKQMTVRFGDMVGDTMWTPESYTRNGDKFKASPVFDKEGAGFLSVSYFTYNGATNCEIPLIPGEVIEDWFEDEKHKDSPMSEFTLKNIYKWDDDMVYLYKQQILEPDGSVWYESEESNMKYTYEESENNEKVC